MSKTFEVIFKEFHNSETFVMSRSLLEDYKRQAAQEERERIINLLAEERFTGPFGYEDGTYMPIDEAIALIKGENE